MNTQPNDNPAPARKKLELPSGRDDITLPDWALAPAIPRHLNEGARRVQQQGAGTTPAK